MIRSGKNTPYKVMKNKVNNKSYLEKKTLKNSIIMGTVYI